MPATTWDFNYTCKLVIVLVVIAWLWSTGYSNFHYKVNIYFKTLRVGVIKHFFVIR